MAAAATTKTIILIIKPKTFVYITTILYYQIHIHKNYVHNNNNNYKTKNIYICTITTTPKIIVYLLNQRSKYKHFSGVITALGLHSCIYGHCPQGTLITADDSTNFIRAR